MAAPVIDRTEELMGTSIRIAVFDDGSAESAVDDAFDWLREVEARFSTYLPESEISLMGRGLLTEADAGRDVRHVLDRCRDLEHATGGAFRIHPEADGLPPIDPSGFVKGWSVDEAALILQVAGTRSFLIDAGGDVLCVGDSPSAGGWRVGVRDPRNPDEIGFTIRIAGGAVASSGAYFRGAHIWSRSTGRNKDIVGVTAVGPELGVADAIATSVYADSGGSLEWLTHFPGYGVAVIHAGGRVEWTTTDAAATAGSPRQEDSLVPTRNQVSSVPLPFTSTSPRG